MIPLAWGFCAAGASCYAAGGPAVWSGHALMLASIAATIAWGLGRDRRG